MGKLTIKDINDKVEEYYGNICKEIKGIILKQNQLSDSIKLNNTNINDLYKKETKFSDDILLLKDKTDELERSLKIITDNLIKVINDLKGLNGKFNKGKLSTLKNLLGDINEIVNKYE